MKPRGEGTEILAMVLRPTFDHRKTTKTNSPCRKLAHLRNRSSACTLPGRIGALSTSSRNECIGRVARLGQEISHLEGSKGVGSYPSLRIR